MVKKKNRIVIYGRDATQMSLSSLGVVLVIFYF